MADSHLTISDLIRARLDDLTRAERQLAESILDQYPASGLGPLTALAAQANVSVPTVARTVQKLGFHGYPEFQAALRDELMAMSRAPAARRGHRAGGIPDRHALATFTETVTENIRQTLDHIDPAAFDAACTLVADRDRHLYIAGGRVSHVIAEYLFQHLQIIRPAITHVRSTSNAWPQYLLNMAQGDVVLLFDMRRYENTTLRLGELARERGARLILFTDQWRSPLHTLAEITLTTRTAVPSPWDSLTTPLLLVEAMIAAVHDAAPDGDARMAALEDMFDRTRLFRKFT